MVEQVVKIIIAPQNWPKHVDNLCMVESHVSKSPSPSEQNSPRVRSVLEPPHVVCTMVVKLKRNLVQVDLPIARASSSWLAACYLSKSVHVNITHTDFLALAMEGSHVTVLATTAWSLLVIGNNFSGIRAEKYPLEHVFCGCRDTGCSRSIMFIDGLDRYCNGVLKCKF